MDGLTGPFLGFRYNGVHSSDLGITRVIEGDRMSINLTPDKKEIFIKKQNYNGSYYYGTYYTQKKFTVPFAFEAVSEEQLRRMSRVWNDKKIHELIFDEEGDKIYSAKVTGLASIKQLCFEENGERIYRGEGSITFTCFFPFARTPQVLKENLGTEIDIVNDGDLEVPFSITFSNPANQTKSFEIRLNNNILTINKDISSERGDNSFTVDFQKHLVVGDNTKTIYNRYIEAGEFFLLPQGENTLQFSIAPTEIKYECLYI